MSDSKWRSPCQGGSISSFKLDSTTKSGIKIISNSDDAVERLKTKQTFNDLKIDTKYRKVNYVHFIWRPTYKWSPWHKSYFFQLIWYFEIFCPQALTLLATDSPPIDQRLALMPTYSLIIFLYQLTNNIYVKLPSYLGTSLATDSLGVKVSNQIWI